MKKEFVLFLSLFLGISLVFAERNIYASEMDTENDDVYKIDEEVINIIKPAYKNIILPLDSDEQYMYGYPDNTFKPEKQMTRAEVTAIFARLLTDEDNIKKDECIFKDVDSEAWYSDYIAFMTKNNLINGYPDGTFRPEEPITRAEFAALVSRFEIMDIESDIDFTDIDKSDWSYQYIKSVTNKGWVNGYPDGKFRPADNITRAEVTKITDKMITKEDKNLKENKNDFSDVQNNYWAYDSIIRATSKKL